MRRTHSKMNIVGAILGLKFHGSVRGVAMATRICVMVHLLDYALTGTTDNEHWRQRQGKVHTIRVHDGRLTRLMTDPSVDAQTHDMLSDRIRCSRSRDWLFLQSARNTHKAASHSSPMMRSGRFQRRAQSTHQPSPHRVQLGIPGNTFRSTKAQGLVVRQIEEVAIRGADFLVQSTSRFRCSAHWSIESPALRN